MREGVDTCIVMYRMYMYFDVFYSLRKIHSRYII